MPVSGYSGQMIQKTATIASGGTDSGALDLAGFNLCGIFLPATFTGTALTFKAAATIGGTYQVVKSTTSGSSLSYTVAQNTYVALDPKDFQGIQFLKIVSGSTEGADRTLTLSLKGF